jgi:hypothetical protein
MQFQDIAADADNTIKFPMGVSLSNISLVTTSTNENVISNNVRDVRLVGANATFSKLSLFQDESGIMRHIYAHAPTVQEDSLSEVYDNMMGSPFMDETFIAGKSGNIAFANYRPLEHEDV